MNHKHRKPRVSRAGCKMCKPWKIGGNDAKLEALKPSERKAKYFANKEIRDYMT